MVRKECWCIVCEGRDEWHDSTRENHRKRHGPLDQATIEELKEDRRIEAERRLALEEDTVSSEDSFDSGQLLGAQSDTSDSEEEGNNSPVRGEDSISLGGGGDGGGGGDESQGEGGGGSDAEEERDEELEEADRMSAQQMKDVVMKQIDGKSHGFIHIYTYLYPDIHLFTSVYTPDLYLFIPIYTRIYTYLPQFTPQIYTYLYL
jgi:hypothetical protein